MRFRRVWPVLALFLFMFGPLISVFIATSIASAHGCLLDEAGVQPCLVLGWDAGALLYPMAVISWFSLVTLPLGFLIGCVWLVVWLARRRKQGTPNPPIR